MVNKLGFLCMGRTQAPSLPPSPHLVIELHRGTIRVNEAEMGRRRDARRIDVAAVRLPLINTPNDD